MENGTRGRTPNDRRTPTQPPPEATHPVAGEPEHVRLAFDRNPLEAAREALMWKVRRNARRAATTPAEAEARTTMAVELARLATQDEDVCTEGAASHRYALEMLAETPAAESRDITRKLAVLVRELLHDKAEGELPWLYFSLAVSALTDAVLLDAGPLDLPAGAELPIKTTADAQRWREVAAREEAPITAGTAR